MRTYILPQLEKEDYMGTALTREEFNDTAADGYDTSPESARRDDTLGHDSEESDDEDVEPEIVSTIKGFTKGEIMYMKAHGTLETPHNFPRVLVETRNKIKKLVFGAFELRTKFPHNIALLKNGTIMYCTDFFETRTPEATTEIYICGFRFLKVTYVSHQQLFIYMRRHQRCLTYAVHFLLTSNGE